MNEYVITHPVYRSNVLGYRNLDSLSNRLFSIASRVRRDDCFDIPETQIETRYVSLTRDQTAEYRAQKIESSRLTSILRRQQYTAQIKAKAVPEIIADWVENDQKIIVYGRFHPELDLICQEVHRVYPSCPLYLLDGRSSDSVRSASLEAFRPEAPSGAACCVANIGVTAGLSLAAANDFVMCSADFDYEHYQQAIDRPWAPEKKKLVQIFMVVPHTVDGFVYEILAKKQSLSEALLDDKVMEEMEDESLGYF